MKGIICALKEEAALITADMKYVKKETVSGMEFTKGKLDGVEIVVAVCGVGKVFAAMCAQTMIIKYAPELIINTGVAGAISSSLRCKDIIVARNVVQHDVDTTAFGDPLGMISGINKTNFQCDKKSVEKLFALNEELGLYGRKNQKIVVIASGDQFITDSAKKEHLKTWFGAIACDMESGAVGQVCYVNKVPFCVIRAISDSANNNSPEDYKEFLQDAANNAATLVKAFITSKDESEE